METPSVPAVQREMARLSEPEADAANGHHPEPSEDSVVGWLKQRRDEIKGGHQLVLEVPGYRGRLHVRYRPVPDKVWSDLKRRQRKRERVGQDTPDMVLAADMMVAACDELLVRRAGAVDLTPLDDEDGFRLGYPARWSPQTAERLGAEGVKNGAVAIFALFPRDDADEVIASVVEGHGQRVYEWLTSLDEEADEEVGEA